MKEMNNKRRIIKFHFDYSTNSVFSFCTVTVLDLSDNLVLDFVTSGGLYCKKYIINNNYIYNH